jgi:hypothetical protein
MITAIDLQERFETTIRSKDKVDGKAFQTSDMDEFFNQAQTDWMKLNIALFDSNERSRRLLSPITKDYEMGGINYTISDGLFWRLYGVPEDTYSVVMESLIVNGNTVLVKPITYDEYLQNIGNKYRQPYDKLAWRLNNENGHTIISTFDSVDLYKLSYVREPNKISINDNTEFSFESEAKNEIVEAAVALALISIQKEEASTKERIQH